MTLQTLRNDPVLEYSRLLHLVFVIQHDHDVENDRNVHTRTYQSTSHKSVPVTHHRLPALSAEAYDPEARSTDLGREVVHRDVRRRADENLKAVRKQNTEPTPQVRIQEISMM